MKKKFYRCADDAGALVTVLCFTIVMAAIAGSMLSIISQEYLLSKRSLAWQQAMSTAESGIELGWNEMNKLTAINTNGTFVSGWTSTGGNTWSVSNQTLTPLAGIEANSTFVVSLSTNSPSAGYATISASGTMSSPIMSQTVTRNVQAVLQPVTPFSFAMLAKGLIDFNGNSVTMDSWNSANGPYSTSLKRAHGSIGTNGSLIDAAGLDLYGSAQTGPGGVVTTDPGFNLYQPSSPDTGTNTVSDGLKVSIPDASVPSALSGLSSSGTLSTTSTITGPTDVKYSSIDLSGNKTVTINGSGTVRLYVTGDTSIGGSSQITLSSGVKVEIYAGGDIDGGGGGVVNNTGYSANLQIYGLPTCTSVNLHGSGNYTGALYAPSAAVTVAGNVTYTGSIVGNTITVPGGPSFHYDEALATTGNVLYYTLSSWREY